MKRLLFKNVKLLQLTLAKQVSVKGWAPFAEAYNKTRDFPLDCGGNYSGVLKTGAAGASQVVDWICLGCFLKGSPSRRFVQWQIVPLHHINSVLYI